MKRHILCVGDSNTHGYCADPADTRDGGVRFDESERWTHHLQAALGEDYLVVEEGLSGRTTVFPDPLNEGMSALEYLAPCLKSHEPVSLLILMLGTNDTKERFSANACAIAGGMKRLILKAQTVECWAAAPPNILVVAPPHIGEGVYGCGAVTDMGAGCAEKSWGLAAQYAPVAALCGAAFLDANFCEFNRVDFMHLTRRGHAQLAEVLAERVRALTCGG